MAKINSMIQVSVIVPVFNSEKYLDKCINSILDQSYKDFELILVNDGSTDSSYDICKKYESLDARVMVIDKNNGGAAQARNIAIQKSNGKYLAFVDSDDYIDANFIKILVKEIESSNADICACSYYSVYDKQMIQRANKPTFKEFNNLEAVRDLLIENSSLETILCNKLFKKQLFSDNNLKLIEGEIYEDTRLLYKLAYYSQKTIFINKPLYYYLQRDGSVMNHGVKLKNLKLQTIITEEAGDWLSQKTNKLDLEIQAYKLTGQINSLNYMVDGKRIYNDIWKKVSRDIKNNFINYLKNPYITKNRKLLVMFSALGKTPYKLLRKIYIKQRSIQQGSIR